MFNQQDKKTQKSGRNRLHLFRLRLWVQGPDLNQRPFGLWCPKRLKALQGMPSRFDHCPFLASIFLPPAAVGKKQVIRPSSGSRTRRMWAYKTQSRDIKKTPRTKSSRSFWVQGPDLNQRPPGYEPDELPDCSTLRYLVWRNCDAGDRNRTGTALRAVGY